MGSSARSGLTPAVAARRQARQAAKARLEQKLRSVLERHAPRLVAGEKGAGLDLQTLGAVLQEIQDDSNLDSIRSARRKLRDMLIAMQKVTGGDVQLPAPEVALHRAPSPFRPQLVRNLPWLSNVIEAFLADLENKPKVGNDLAAARIVFSAIVFGGLLNPVLVSRFPSALDKSLAQHAGLCWLDIPLPGKDKDSGERIRRWFPDPASQCLMVRWVKDEKSWPEGKLGAPAELLRFLLNHLKVPDAAAAQGSLRGLLVAAQTRLRIHLPGVLVDFLASADHGQSVPARVWWRLLADYHLATPDEQPGEQEEADEICAVAEPPEAEPTKHIGDSSLDLQSVAALKKCLMRGRSYLKPTAASRALVALRQSLGPRGPMFTALLDWTEWLLHMLSSGTRRAQPQSVHRYLGSFAHPLIATAGEIDPADTPPSLLQAKYQETLASIRSDDERGLAAKRLRDFHSFLVLTRDVPPVEIDGIASGKQRVRANVISEVEYTRTLGLIDRSELDHRTRAMLRVMLIVAYRLGPRRNELAYLRLNDVHDGSGTGAISARPLLWIHSHPDARLKTDDSIRRLPLAHLLTPDERKEVLAWKQHRVAAMGPNRPDQALLFCVEGRDTERLRDANIDVLVEMLRHVCKDGTIVFHTLRHSFLSNTFVRLMLGELAVQGAPRKPCPWLIESGKRQDFLRRVFNANVLPREAAYLLCTLAGHLDPTETMHTYVHFQDWIAGLFLRELAADWPISLWAAHEGIQPDALMVRHSRDKKRTGYPVLAHLDTPRRLLKELKLGLPAGTPAEPVPTPMPVEPDPRSRLERLPLEGIYCLIALAGRSMSHQAREHVTGIDRHTFERLRTAALQVASTKTATRNRDLRRPRFLADRKEKRRRPTLSRLPQLDGIAPAIPRERSERNDAREVYRRAFQIDNPIDQDALQSILDRTSHSDPVVVSTTLEDLANTITVLKKLGIPRERVGLEIRSLPRSAVAVDQWILEVARRTDIPVEAIESAGIEAPVTRSARTHPAGRIAVRVLQPARATTSPPSDVPTPPAPDRLAYGWRVGCYYALCVKRSQS
jgi:integrase